LKHIRPGTTALTATCGVENGWHSILVIQPDVTDTALVAGDGKLHDDVDHLMQQMQDVGAR
jgi:hypothetical protein